MHVIEHMFFINSLEMLSFQVINIKRSSPEIRAQFRVARTSSCSPFCCSGIGSHRLSCWSHSEFVYVIYIYVAVSTSKHLNFMGSLKL